MAQKEFKNLFEYYKFTKKDEKQYPVISRILKSLTPERIKKEIEAVQKVKLPSDLEKWVKEYEKVGERDRFIWKWTCLNMENLTLSTVTQKYKNSVLVAKCSSIIINVLIDDLADKRKNEKMLKAAFNILFSEKKFYSTSTFSNFPKEDQKYLNLIRKIWIFLNHTIKKFPRYKDFKEVFLYDYYQFFNSVRFSYLVNKNFDLINQTEYRIYLSQNMQGIVVATIDLMASPMFKMEELGYFRELFWRAQRMGKIGNSLTTWKREISEDDFSSEIFAYAIANNILHKAELKKSNKEKIIEKIGKARVQNYFLGQWEKYYKEIEKLDKKIKSINVKKILKGLRQLIAMHLCSIGFK